jgi:hypothetical protein
MGKNDNKSLELSNLGYSLFGKNMLRLGTSLCHRMKDKQAGPANCSLVECKILGPWPSCVCV